MSPEKLLIAQDIDECLFNSVKRHHARLTIIGEQLGWTNLPTYEQVCALGGTHGAYGEQPGYWEINRVMTESDSFNAGLEVIEGSLETLQLLAPMMGAYLTTRSEKVQKRSKYEISDHGFPLETGGPKSREIKLICRPENIPVSQTTEWKTWMLSQLAMEFQAQMLMIDDSANLHAHLNRAKKNGSRGQLDTVLYAGPMTPKGNGEKTWEEIGLMMSDGQFAA
jgi:hypothetical protein